jgi:carboxylesterase
MPNYTATAAAMLREARTREAALTLRHPTCRAQFWLHPQPTAKVCLFFHGFTAAPYQFIPMGEALSREGYNVLVPLMPGHGRAGEWGPDRPPPLPTEIDTYRDFARQWLEYALALGEEVAVGGISGGGTVAAWLALEYASQVDRALLFAPYLSGSSKVVDLLVEHIDLYFAWQGDGDRESLAYPGFYMPALRTMLDLGGDVLQRARKPPVAPMFVISSESDRAVDNRDHVKLFELVSQHAPKSWYHCFDRVMDIPHTMMTREEGNRYEYLLIALSRAYIQSDLSWDEVRDIAYRMTQGKTFNQAARELGLIHLASADMPAMMTMVDKRAIVEQRNPSWRRR